MGEVLTWQQQEIDDAVRELVVKNFPKAVAHRIEITSDTGHYGDPILRIRIMVEPFSAATGPGMVDLTRILRERLIAHNVDDFPIVSYVSKKDLEQLTRGSR
jgi:RNA binding exosome subunit